MANKMAFFFFYFQMFFVVGWHELFFSHFCLFAFALKPFRKGRSSKNETTTKYEARRAAKNATGENRTIAGQEGPLRYSVFVFAAKINFPDKRQGVVARIEAVLGDLESLGPLTSPFSQLDGQANIRRRVLLAKRAVELVAGENPTTLLKEICGHRNKTADCIAESYQKIRAAKETAGTQREISTRQVFVFFPGSRQRYGLRPLNFLSAAAFVRA